MVTKLIVGGVTLAVLLSLAVWGQLIPLEVSPALAQGATNQEVTTLADLGYPGLESIPYTRDMQVLFEEMTLVWLQDEAYASVKTACAGNGLRNIQPLADGPMILIPNAGDLAVNGSNVAIQLNPDGQITFVPRVQGQLIRLPMAVGDKLAEQEVPSLTLGESMQLMAAGELVWTAKHHGPYGNGHGLPGHIAACDPLYNDDKFDSEEED